MAQMDQDSDYSMKFLQSSGSTNDNTQKGSTGILPAKKLVM